VPLERSRARIAIVTGANMGMGTPGGTRSYVLGLSRFLVENRFGVELITNGRVDEAPKGCAVRPARLDYMPSSFRFHRNLRRWATLANLTGVDLIHFQRPDDFAAFLHLNKLPPTVCTLHGDPWSGVRRRRGKLLELAYRRLERKALRRIGAIVAVDSATAEVYSKRYPLIADRLHIIPNAVDDSFIAEEVRSGDGPSPAQPPVFVFAGRLSVEKRVDRIIAAVTGYPALRGAKLVIAGAGPEEERLRRFANGLPVEFVGQLNRRELSALYRRADALVIASEFEGLPTVALEAVAVGCPVVALEGSGADWIRRDGLGILAPSPGGLSEALAAAVPLRRQGASIHVPSKYTWSSVGPQILDVYRRVREEVKP